MNHKKNLFISLLLGAFLFNGLFWQEKMGINTLAYDLFLSAVLFWLYPEARRSSTVRWLFLGRLTALAMIVVHNTLLSKVAYIILLPITTAFMQYAHRSAWYAAGSVLQNSLFVVPGILDALPHRNAVKTKRPGFWRIFRLLLIPAGLTFVFLILYSASNPLLGDFIGKRIEAVAQWLQGLWTYFRPARFFFLLFGLLCTGWLILRSKFDYFSRLDMQQPEQLQRVRRKLTDPFSLPEQFHVLLLGKWGKGNLSLKNWYLVGLLSLLLLNLLLLTLNSIDIPVLWFGQISATPAQLSQMTHTGISFLIFSLVLAIGVLLLFFRGNLNFYKQSKGLRVLVVIWIVQNIILIFSVWLRDYYYIQEVGLTYKRIGIVVYLLLALAGLLTVLFKVLYNRSVYFLFRTNAWAAVILLVLATTVNWDGFIARWNIAHSTERPVPVSYLLSLSEKVVPELEPYLRQHPVESSIVHGPSQISAVRKLELMKAGFAAQQQEYSFLSWNLADIKLKQYWNIQKSEQ